MSLSLAKCLDFKREEVDLLLSVGEVNKWNPVQDRFSERRYGLVIA